MNLPATIAIKKRKGRRKGTNSLNFGITLRKIMDERGLTVRAIAELASVNSSVVQSWIGKANPHDLEAVGRLAKALNIGFKQLVLGEPEDSLQAFPSSFEQEIILDGLCHVTIRKIIVKKEGAPLSP